MKALKAVSLIQRKKSSGIRTHDPQLHSRRSNHWDTKAGRLGNNQSTHVHTCMYRECNTNKPATQVNSQYEGSNQGNESTKAAEIQTE